MSKNGTVHVDAIQLEAYDPAAAARWFCDELWFEACYKNDDSIRLQNGNCRLLITRKNRAKQIYASDAPFAGYEHLALEAPDIDKALAYCQSKGMVLETDNNGKAFYNPKVWGTGMYYFNILTGFGVKVEISQRLDRPAYCDGSKLVIGLEHLGIEVSDIERSIAYYTELGFAKGCPLVENITAERRHVLCIMMTLEDIILELFQFTDKTAYQTDANNGVQNIVIVKNLHIDTGLLAIGPDAEKAVIL